MKVRITLEVDPSLDINKNEADMLGRLIVDDIAESEVGSMFQSVERESVKAFGQPYKVWPKVEALKGPVVDLIARKQLRAGLLAIRSSVDRMLEESR